MGKILQANATVWRGILVIFRNTAAYKEFSYNETMRQAVLTTGDKSVFESIRGGHVEGKALEVALWALHRRWQIEKNIIKKDCQRLKR